MGRLVRLARAAIGRTPFHLVFFVTSRCNAKCRYCFYWDEISKRDKPEELSIEEVRRIASNLPNLGYVTITGGEPSLRDDVPAIIEAFYRRSQARIVSYHTNGLLGERVCADVSEALSRCPELCLDVCVSVDAMGKKHDRLKGVSGSFDRAIATLARLKQIRREEPRLGIFTVSVFCASNSSSDIIEVHRYLVRELGVSNGVALIRNSAKDEDEFGIEIDEYLRLCEELEAVRPERQSQARYPLFSLREAIESFKYGLIARTARAQRQLVPCVAGRRSIVLAEDGSLFPCELLKSSYGNVREAGYDPMRLVASETGRRIRSRIENKECFCTWEILIALSTFYHLPSYPKVIAHWLSRWRRARQTAESRS